jgi:hypothetical protein
MAREPFESVSPSDWPVLVAALERARPNGFVDNIDTCGAPQYICAEWSPSDLLQTITLPVFGGLPYPIFLARPPGTDRNGNVDPYDPRYVNHRIPLDPDFAHFDPLIAIIFDGKKMLIEGYLRSILWLRNPKAPLWVWVPKR